MLLECSGVQLRSLRTITGSSDGLCGVARGIPASGGYYRSSAAGRKETGPNE